MLRLISCLAILWLSNSSGQEVELLQRLSGVESLLEEFEGRLVSTDDVIHEQRLSLQSLIDPSYPKQVDIPVAFSAHALSTEEYENGDIIEFGGVITNHGFDYFPVSSTFTCPYDGLYIFSATLYTEDDNNIAADIIINGAPLVQVYAPDTIQSDQASHLVTTVCYVGDVVQVRCAIGGTLEGYLNNALTTFSGVLIARI